MLVSGSVPGARPMPRSMPARVRRLEERELLGHHQRRVVGQHHAAGADPDPLGGGSDHGDQDRGVGGGHGRHVVVLGQPVAPEAQAVRDAGERTSRGQRLPSGLAVANGHQVEHGERG